MKKIKAVYKSTDTKKTLKELGFSCLDPTFFKLENGSEVLVQADCWMLKDKKLKKDENENKLLRFYHVYYEKRTENLDEIDVVNLLGEKNWNDL